MKPLLFYISVLLLSSCHSFGDVVELNQTSVFYKETGLKAKAIAAANHLEVLEFTNGIITYAQVTRDTIYNIRVVVPESIANNDRLQPNFQALGFSFSTEIFNGHNINFQLCDKDFNTIKNIPIKQSKL